MKNIQARLQSRISKRSAAIATLENAINNAKVNEYWDNVRMFRKALNDLTSDQLLDKDIIRNTHWGREW